MIKNLKIFSIIGLLLILLSFTTNVLAVDMNITETNTQNTSNASNTSNNSNTTNSTNTQANTSSSSSSASTNSVTVQGGLPESNLGISNILSIILIAIGVLLILLAIAILIRLGK